MRTLMTALTATALLGAALAAPADAQVRRTTPPAGGTVKTTAAVAGPTGSSEFRPTNVFGVQRAQTLVPGAAVVGISNNANLFTLPGSSLSLNLGLTDGLELAGIAGLDLNNIGANFDTNVNLGAGLKYRLSNADNLGIALSGGLLLNKATGNSNLNTTLFASLPVSFWIGQRGGFHVEPGFAFGNVNNTTSTNFGTGLAYEMELNPTWRLMLRDNLSFNNGVVANNYQAGVRVGVTPNTTVDVSVLNGFLNFGTPNNNNLGAANVTLLNFAAYFGGPSAQVRPSFGL